ncbi:MAG: 4-phosphoerythronate dehydrogenase [Porticoccaceae bacterium]
MKIVADSAMSQVVELFSPFGEVVTSPGRAIGPADVATADILLVRSVTVVDEPLLRDSAIRFVGSATSGTDHVDLEYLRTKGIAFASAPGCNAQAVVEYVLSVLCGCRPGWRSESIGIIGCGNVGRRLYQALRGLGVTCRVYDPFLPAGAIADLASLDEVLNADILCLHTPLTRTGQHPTFHLIDGLVLARLRPGALLINAGRGAVVDGEALLRHLQSDADLQVALDVWETEPDINIELLRRVILGTPHIAGYSREGRLRGSLMVRAALCQWLGTPLPTSGVVEVPRLLLLPSGTSVSDLVLAAYDARIDHRRMVAAIVAATACDGNVGAVFDRLRTAALDRREFSGYRPEGVDAELAPALVAAGFSALSGATASGDD